MLESHVCLWTSLSGHAYNALICHGPTTGFKGRFSPSWLTGCINGRVCFPKRMVLPQYRETTLNRINHRCPLYSAWHARRIRLSTHNILRSCGSLHQNVFPTVTSSGELRQEWAKELQGFPESKLCRCVHRATAEYQPAVPTWDGQLLGKGNF